MRSILSVVTVLVLLATAAPAGAAGDPEPAPGGAPAATVSASAEAPIVVLGLGAGAFIPTSKLGVNFLVNIDGSYQLPWLSRKLGVGLGLGYSQPTTSGQVIDSRIVNGGAADYSSTMRELLLDVRLSFRLFSWQSVWSPHVAIGPAFYFLSHTVDALGHEQTESSTQVGFSAILGADYRIWRGAVILEVRIPFATVGQKTTGDSNVGAASVLFGYRFRI